MDNNTKKLKLAKEVLGLYPLPVRLKQAKNALFGEKDIPRAKFGLSSLKQLYPKISIKLWRGKYYLDKTVIISNLFNHTQTPIEQGWSVKKTQVLDFRNKQLTYNSHNGTDFTVPVGSTVTTAAPGEVVAVMSEFNRGGLKIFIDHGNGLMTTYAHLARSLVNVGDVLKRGQPIALSGYSGLDGAVTFPFGLPHVHFNVWLNAKPTDPFAYNDTISLWKVGNMPIVTQNINEDDTFIPSVYNKEYVIQAINACKTIEVKQRLLNINNLKEQAAQLIIEMNYYPTRFVKKINPYIKTHERTPILDLPFSKSEFDKVVFLDEIIKVH